MTDASAAYEALTKHLADLQYAFVCPSPETQGRVVQKRRSEKSTASAKNAQDFFGWSLSCSRETLSFFLTDALFESLSHWSIIHQDGNNQYKSAVRVSNFYLPQHPSTKGGSPLYYVHSSFPASSDSVFFGPDTYIFVEFLRHSARHMTVAPQSIIDVCCGSGAGAIHMARAYPNAKVFGLDLNPRALSLGGVNARLAETQVDFRESNLYSSIPEDLKTSGVDLIISNPPYIASSADGKDLPIYADGGAAFGLDISLHIVEEGVQILSPQGVMLVYTGVAIPTSDPAHDAFLEKLQSIKHASVVEYTILHPDMWPEEIGTGAYADVCRIQVVGAVVKKQG